MSGKRAPITYKGRSLGIITLTVAQLLIGVIHLLVGLTLLAAEILNRQGSLAYDVYTVAFGSLILVFTAYIWQGKKAGWIGTCAVLLFVILVDSLTVLGLPSIPGIPTFAAPTEIGYSIIVIVYLSLPHVRRRFLV
ncbi:MAG: hypothetical protein ABSG33_08475 [Candidatus Bathyarchaeia archaeon]|jgi:hypothetical protein